MRNSEIFDNYVKIAEEKGLIPSDAPDKAKKALEKNPRADSLDISAIEALYGVKPDIPKDMQYDNNIMEDAHPNSVIISPSYDKVHGLVENDIERQNITINIINQNPTGLSTQRKYATKELTLALAKIANDLDNHDKDELRKLADTCLFQLAGQSKKKVSKTITKKAFMPYVIGISSLLGIIYMQQHMPFVSEGFKRDHEKLIAEIDDMLSNAGWTAFMNLIGMKYEYTSNFKQQLSELKSKLTEFYDEYVKVEPILEELARPRTAKELVELSKQPQTETVIEAYNNLHAQAEQIIPYLEQDLQNFKSQTFKARQIASKGFGISLIDRLQMLHGGSGLVADDFDDIARAIPAYEKSLQALLSELQNARSLEEKAKKDITQAAAKSQKMFGDVDQPTPSQSPSSVKSLDQEATELGTQIKGLTQRFSNF